MKINRLIQTLDIMDYLKLVLAETKESKCFYQSFEKIESLPIFIKNLAFNRFKCLLLKDGVIMSALEVESLLDDDATEEIEDRIILTVFSTFWDENTTIVKDITDDGQKIKLLMNQEDFDNIIKTWKVTSLNQKLMYIDRLDYLENRNILDIIRPYLNPDDNRAKDLGK